MFLLFITDGGKYVCTMQQTDIYWLMSLHHPNSSWSSNTQWRVSAYQCHIHNDLYLFIRKIDLLNWEIPHLHPIRPYKDPVISPTGEIPHTLHSVLFTVIVSGMTSGNKNKYTSEYKSEFTHKPSFLPMGSSYSMPTHTPVLLNCVGPTNRTVPRLCKPSSAVSTSHRAPTGMLAWGYDCAISSSESFSANLPILFRCLYASTVSISNKLLSRQ